MGIYIIFYNLQRAQAVYPIALSCLFHSKDRENRQGREACILSLTIFFGVAIFTICQNGTAKLL